MTEIVKEDTDYFNSEKVFNEGCVIPFMNFKDYHTFKESLREHPEDYGIYDFMEDYSPYLKDIHPEDDFYVRDLNRNRKIYKESSMKNDVDNYISGGLKNLFDGMSFLGK
jgi:hypothetical protein